MLGLVVTPVALLTAPGAPVLPRNLAAPFPASKPAASLLNPSPFPLNTLKAAPTSPATAANAPAAAPVPALAPSNTAPPIRPSSIFSYDTVSCICIAEGRYKAILSPVRFMVFLLNPRVGCKFPYKDFCAVSRSACSFLNLACSASN